MRIQIPKQLQQLTLDAPLSSNSIKNSNQKQRRLLKFPQWGNSESALLQKQQKSSHNPDTPTLNELLKKNELRQQINKSKPGFVYGQAQMEIRKPRLTGLQDLVTKVDPSSSCNNVDLGQLSIKSSRLGSSRQLTLTDKGDNQLFVNKQQSATPTIKHQQQQTQQYQFNDKFERSQLILSKIGSRSNSLTKVSGVSQRNNINMYYLSQIEASYKRKSNIDKQIKIVREHFIQTHQGLNLRLLPVAEAQRVEFFPKSNSEQITLIFDLDETLVHCNESIMVPYDVCLEIAVNNGKDKIKAGINIRPYAKEVLKRLSQKFELIVFTASHSCYANQVINYLDSDGSIFKYRLFRENCTPTNLGLFTKDLKVLIGENRQLSNMLLVDNASYSYNWQIDNGIPILPFYDQKDDTQLLQLESYLNGIVPNKDVRQYNRENLKLISLTQNRLYTKAYEEIFGTPLP